MWSAGGVFRNEDIFTNPEVYEPERFIKNPENAKVTDLIFGTGRVRYHTMHHCSRTDANNIAMFQRACPGMHLAKNAIVC